MDKNKFFQSVIGFIANMRASTHFLIKDAQSDKVTPQQNAILEHLFFSNGVTTSQVADCLNISLPNTSRELKKLTQLDLIVKKSDPKDRRKATIILSEPGRKLMLQTFERIQKIFWEQTGELSEDEMRSIVSAMGLLEKKMFSS